MPGNKLKEPLSGASTFKGFPHHQPVPPQLILNSDLHNPIDSRLPTPADFYIFIFLTRLANANFGAHNSSSQGMKLFVGGKLICSARNTRNTQKIA